MLQQRLIGVIVFLAIFSLAVPGLASDTLLRNGSFEDVNLANMVPSAWATSIFDNSEVIFTADPNTSRSGSYSARIEGKPSEAAPRGPRGSMSQYVDSAAGFVPHGVYRISAWYRTQGISNPKSVEIRMNFRDSARNAIHFSQDPTFQIVRTDHEWVFEGDRLLHIYAQETAEDEWKEIELYIRAPEKAADMRIELFLWRESGILWWDDVTVERIG